jgi:hypothetical protein
MAIIAGLQDSRDTDLLGVAWGSRELRHHLAVALRVVIGRLLPCSVGPALR